jgi:type I restriction enzyme S subunit
MSFPRYSKYKASGVEWLGDVPEHWEVKRLKRFSNVFPSNVDKKIYDGETPVKLCNYTDVYYNDIITSDLELMDATASTEQIAKFTLRAGDTIITKDSETANDIAIGAYVPVDLPGIVCGYHLSVIRPMPETNGAFIKRLFDSVYVKGCVEVRANGLTRVGLGQYEINNLDLPFPPLPEQTVIAAFLDRETAKIDGLIAEQRRLMELLKEKRQAVISHAVTKGLNPHAKMKPSGVEWLGDVPEHWEIVRIKRVATIRYGIGEPPKYHDNGTPLIRATNIHAGKLFAEGMVFVDPTEIPEQRIVWLAAGDIIVVRSGAYTGDSAIIPDGFGPCIAGFDMVLKCHTARPEFVQFALLSKYLKEGQLDLEKMRAAQPHLNAEELGSCILAMPNSKEQDAVTKFLKSKSAEFDTLTAEAQRAIDLLQERRTALISAAVTGQIDVRNINTKETA